MRKPIFLILISTSINAFGLVGGQLDKSQSFSSTVRLWPDKFGNSCTAVKISSRFFLTAAHCFNEYDEETQFISLIQGPPWNGDKALLSASIYQYGKSYPVTAKAVYLHPFWRTKISKNLEKSQVAEEAFSGEVLDLALYEVETDTPINESTISFEPIMAEKFESIVIGGYGSNENGASPAYPSFGIVSSFQTKGNLVAVLSQIVEEAETDAPRIALRFGDSGGPAFTLSPNNQLLVSGINSGGSGVNTKFEIGTIARLDTAKAWICTHVSLPECSK
jgi:hypothetical protein